MFTMLHRSEYASLVSADLRDAILGGTETPRSVSRTSETSSTYETLVETIKSFSDGNTSLHDEAKLFADATLRANEDNLRMLDKLNTETRSKLKPETTDEELESDADEEQSEAEDEQSNADEVTYDTDEEVQSEADDELQSNADTDEVTSTNDEELESDADKVISRDDHMGLDKLNKEIRPTMTSDADKVESSNKAARPQQSLLLINARQDIIEHMDKATKIKTLAKKAGMTTNQSYKELIKSTVDKLLDRYSTFIQCTDNSYVDQIPNIHFHHIFENFQEDVKELSSKKITSVQLIEKYDFVENHFAFTDVQTQSLLDLMNRFMTISNTINDHIEEGNGQMIKILKDIEQNILKISFVQEEIKSDAKINSTDAKDNSLNKPSFEYATPQDLENQKNEVPTASSI